ncbi:MAG: hypothetical protein ACR2PH_15295 [Desulfobulbia bacterium]
MPNGPFDIFTAHSLRSLEAQRTLSSFILLFSVERKENNKNHVLRAFRIQKYRAAIDFFFFRPLNGKRKVSLLCAICAFAVKMKNEINQIT